MTSHPDMPGVAADPTSLATRLLADREGFLAFLRARKVTPADAEDLFQQALAKAALHAGDLRDPDRTRAWFFRILRRLLADHRSQHASDRAKLAGLAGLAQESEETPSEPSKICGCSLALLAQIRPDYADILRRVELEEHSLAEAAAALGISVNNATVRLHRARRSLRDELQAFCGTTSMRACLDCGCCA